MPCWDNELQYKWTHDHKFLVLKKEYLHMRPTQEVTLKEFVYKSGLF